MAERDQDPLADFAHGIAAKPLTDPRRIGAMLIQIGMAVCLAFLCVSIAGMNIGMLIAACGILIARAPIHRCVGFWWGVGFSAWQVVSRLLGNNDFHGLGLVYIWLCMPLAEMAFHHALPGAAQVRRWTVIVLTAGAVLSVIVSVLQFTVGIDDTSPPWRISGHGLRLTQTMGFFALHLTQGSVMGLVFFLALGLMPWCGRVTSWIGCVVTMTGVILSGGRASLLGMCGGVVVHQALQGNRRYLCGALSAVGILAAGCLMILFMTPYRLSNLMIGQDGRWVIWQTSVQVVSAHPLFGAGGPREYQAAYKETYPRLGLTTVSEFPDGAPHAHNTVLAIAGEHGIPASLLFVVLLWLPLAKIWPGDPRQRAAAFGFFTMMIVFSQFENLSAQASHVVWGGFGALLAARQQNSGI